MACALCPSVLPGSASKAKALTSAAKTHGSHIPPGSRKRTSKAQCGARKVKKTRAETDTKKTLEKISETKSQVFEKTKKINKPLAKLTRKKKREDSNKSRNK